MITILTSARTFFGNVLEVNAVQQRVTLLTFLAVEIFKVHLSSLFFDNFRLRAWRLCDLKLDIFKNFLVMILNHVACSWGLRSGFLFLSCLIKVSSRHDMARRYIKKNLEPKTIAGRLNRISQSHNSIQWYIQTLFRLPSCMVAFRLKQ